MSGRYVFLSLLLLLPFVGWSQLPEKACFSVPGGFYEESPTLEITPFYSQHHIRFTTNGNSPTAQSQLYSEPLLLDESLYSRSDIYTIQVTVDGQMFYPDSIRHCIVIRAAVFDENDSCISEVTTNSYFIQALGCDTHGLPVMSICSDSLGLFDYHNGILVPGSHQSQNTPLWTGNYFCHGLRWERPCNVEFYELNNTGINQQAGLRTHGGGSRRLQQKGLKVYAKEEYGQKRFLHRFFQQIPHESFKHLSIKPFRCSNWKKTGLQDALAHQVARSIGLECLAFRQMVLFLNGEYWGIYALEEDPDSHYLEDHFFVDPEQCNIIKKWKQLDSGDSTNWHNLCQWIQTADLSIPENYNTINELIDIDNFIDYQIFEIYSSNVDWPANNVRCWQEDNGKWRWIFYDGDGCFFKDWDVFANATDTSHAVNPSNARATQFFRKLIENPTFFSQFNLRFRALMSNQLDGERILPWFQSLCAQIEAEVPNQAERFGFPVDYGQWVQDTALVSAYLRSQNERITDRLDQFVMMYALPENQVATGLSCYPNPSDGSFVLSLNCDVSGFSPIQIFDVLGRLVYEKEVILDAGSNQFFLEPSLPTGLYFLKIDQRVTKIIRK